METRAVDPDPLGGRGVWKKSGGTWAAPLRPTLPPEKCRYRNSSGGRIFSAKPRRPIGLGGHMRRSGGRRRCVLLTFLWCFGGLLFACFGVAG